MDPMIDTHTHLHDPQFEADRGEVIRRAQENGIERLITVGTDLETSRKAVELAARVDAVHATVGVHPHDVKTIGSDTYPLLEDLARSRKVVAYGEVGLDFYYMHSPKAMQTEHFRSQIRMAKRLGLPLVIHMRDAASETIAILRDEKAGEVGGVFHCFTGDLATARQAMEINFFISFSGILTFNKSTDLQEVAREIPIERLLVETDCPYLAPVPHRGKRNEPAYVRLVAEKLAELKGCPLPELALQARENSKQAFPKLA